MKRNMRWTQPRARSRGESLYPNLWPVAGYAPSLGPTGGTLYDLSGNKNHGAITGATWGAGALGFDGSDYVNVPLTDKLTITDAITLSVWVRRTSNDYTVHRGIVATNAYPTPYLLRITQTGGTLLWLVDAASVVSVAGAVLPLDEWAHVVATYDGANLRLYRNGEIEGGPTALTGAIDYTAEDISIGSWRRALSEYFIGDIKDCAIYNRALTPSEIKQLYIDPLCWLRRRDEGQAWYSSPAGGLSVPIASYHYQQSA